MPSYALAAIGRDRPGIVAAISRVLFEHGCNIEDSTMSMLRGNFAVMLVLAAPDGLAADELQAALAPTCRELGLLYDVLPVDDRALVPQPTHHLSVYGADKAGILYRITDALASQGVNITDLASRLVGEADAAVYVVMLELALPESCEPEALETHLRTIAFEVGVDLTIREVEDDLL